MQKSILYQISRYQKNYPLMLDGLNKNRVVVQKTSPGRLEVAFSNVPA